MSKLPNCPKCNSEYVYEDGHLMICPECGYEWTASSEEAQIVRDANGNQLAEGDSITIMKDLKVKGGSGPLKRGTKIKNIKFIDDGIHNLEAYIPGFGGILIKSEFVKKL